MEYNPSAKLKEARGYFFNLNFEILNGCKFNCVGCYVEKNSQTPMSKEDLQKLCLLFSDMERNYYTPWIALIGPTDFLVADNTILSLADPENQKLFKKFRKLALQTTLLDMRKAEAIVQALRMDYPDMEIEIGILLDPRQLQNPVYLNKIHDNKRALKSLFAQQSVLFFGLINLVEADQKKLSEVIRDYDSLQIALEPLFFDTVEHYKHTGQEGAPFLDYNFSAGRSRDLSNTEVLSFAHELQKIFNTSIRHDSPAPYFRFSFGKLQDSLFEKQYTFRQGHLFASPYFYERFVAFHPSLEVPLRLYSVQEIETFEQDLQLSQFRFAEKTDECEDCLYLPSCTERGVLKLMEIYGSPKCIVAKEALNTVNALNLGSQFHV